MKNKKNENEKKNIIILQKIVCNFPNDLHFISFRHKPWQKLEQILLARCMRVSQAQRESIVAPAQSPRDTALLCQPGNKMKFG